MEWLARFSIAAAAIPPVFHGSWRRTRWGVVASSQPLCSTFAVRHELVFATPWVSCISTFLARFESPHRDVAAVMYSKRRELRCGPH